MSDSQNPSPNLPLTILRGRFFGVPFGAGIINLASSFALAALAFDILCRCGVWTDGSVSYRGGYYMLLGALLFFLPALPPLLVEMFLIRRGSPARLFAIAYILLLLLAAGLLYASFRLRINPKLIEPRLTLRALALCIAGNSVFLLAAHLRARLTYRYRLSVIEVPPAENAPLPADAASL